MIKSDNKLLKSCERRYDQTSLLDSREFKGDLLDAAIQVRQAQLALQDALFVLEMHLEEVIDRDEGGRC